MRSFTISPRSLGTSSSPPSLLLSIQVTVFASPITGTASSSRSSNNHGFFRSSSDLASLEPHQKPPRYTSRLDTPSRRGRRRLYGFKQLASSPACVRNG